MTKKVMLRGGAFHPTVEDALSYVHMVQETFLYDDEEKYFDFLAILKDFRNGRIDITNAIAQVRALLKEHPELLIEFEYFLPPRHRMARLWCIWSRCTRAWVWDHQWVSSKQQF